MMIFIGLCSSRRSRRPQAGRASSFARSSPVVAVWKSQRLILWRFPETSSQARRASGSSAGESFDNLHGPVLHTAPMKKLLSVLSLAVALALCGGCAIGPSRGSYKVTAFKPHNPNNVRVKVSTSTQHIYVLEGNRLLMAIQGCVGTAQDPTPAGNFTINNKIKTKRRISQPDAGYPMAYWCEFKTAYGFHEGFVHPHPRTHGCIRLHKEAAARLFALVKIGTPVNISRSQPEDSQYGHFVRKLDESRDPNPPRAFMMSPAWFRDPAGPLLVEG